VHARGVSVVDALIVRRGADVATAKEAIGE
jgi:hypothetical protein